MHFQVHGMIQEELAVLRLKLSELVDENKRLHTELKTTVVHEIMRDGTDLIKVGGIGFCVICFCWILSECICLIAKRHSL